MFGHPPPQDTTATRIPAEPLPALRARHGGARPPASSSSHPTSWGSPRAPLALGAARLPPALGVPCLTPAPPLLLLPWPLPVSCPDGAPCPAPFTWVPSCPVPAVPCGHRPLSGPWPFPCLLAARPASGSAPELPEALVLGWDLCVECDSCLLGDRGTWPSGDAPCCPHTWGTEEGLGVQAWLLQGGKTATADPGLAGPSGEAGERAASELVPPPSVRPALRVRVSVWLGTAGLSVATAGPGR